jgi:hypothetical protein
MSRTPVQQRSWLSIRWRQLRNPPPPVLRAVLANLAVAGVGALVLLAVDRLAAPVQGSTMALLVTLYVAVVLLAGSLLTWRWVELPTGASGQRRRSAWAGLLGLFAGIPIAYLVLVVTFQVVRPALGQG